LRDTLKGVFAVFADLGIADYVNVCLIDRHALARLGGFKLGHNFARPGNRDGGQVRLLGPEAGGKKGAGKKKVLGFHGSDNRRFLG